MTWLLDTTYKPLWIPVVVLREDGRPCICYAPHDEDCECALPVEETVRPSR
jgi:hypothetical protein